MRAWFAAGALALAACTGGSPTMEPGRDCLRCHGGGDAPRWTVAGTVFPAVDAPTSAGLLDAHVTITDQTGWTFTIQSNVAGNFYTAESVAFPIQVCVEYQGTSRCMSSPVTTGGCNSCHAQPPTDGAAGRISVP